MLPTIGITTGDPSGIGLEVVLKSISSVLPSARWILFTDRSIFERNIEPYAAGLKWQWIHDTTELSSDPILFLYDVGGDSSAIEWGKVSPVAGDRAMSYLEAASGA